MQKEKSKSPFGATCSTCPFWIKSHRDKYYQSDDGQFFPVTAVSLGALPPGANLLTKGQVDMAPCSFQPMWFPAPSDHWCWQHTDVQGAREAARLQKSVAPWKRDPTLPG